MIVSADRNPKYSLYYIGGLIINILEKEDCLAFDIIIDKIFDRFQGEIAVNYIYYSFDWLYLLSLIEIKNDKVILCK
nr:MAG TPA: hypothetical protein [Caudoviricetes sp.]